MRGSLFITPFPRACSRGEMRKDVARSGFKGSERRKPGKETKYQWGLRGKEGGAAEERLDIFARHHPVLFAFYYVIAQSFAGLPGKSERLCHRQGGEREREKQIPHDIFTSSSRDTQHTRTTGVSLFSASTSPRPIVLTFAIRFHFLQTAATRLPSSSRAAPIAPATVVPR